MTHVRTVLVMLVVLSGIAMAADDVGVRGLLDDLAGDDFRQRQLAEDRLVSLGEPARGPIGEALARTHDVEVRTRLESALRRIDGDRVTGPTYVTLHLKDATARQAFTELAKQSFAPPLKPFPENLLEQPPLHPITLDVEGQPFWTAVRKLSEKSGIGVQGWDDGLRLVQGPGHLAGPGVVQGPFLVVATQVSHARTIMLGGADGVDPPARPPLVRDRQDEFGIHFLVLPEPKLTVLRPATSLQIERAVDDTGNDLIIPRPANANGGGRGQSFAIGTGRPPWPLYVRLQYPRQPGKRIARLSASTTFVVQTRAERIEILEPLKLKDAFRFVGGSRVTFQAMTKDAGGYELTATLVSGAATPDNAATGTYVLIQSMQARMQVLTADGRKLEPRGFSSRGDARETELTLRYFAPQDGAEPARLVWDVPMETKELPLEFEFKDLPMP